jgi:hypothetical protein
MNLARHQLVAISLLVVALLVLSCGPGSSETPRIVVVTALPTSAPSVITVVVTSPPLATAELPQPPAPRPTDTAGPTAAPAPTDIPRPSPSPTLVPTVPPATRVVQPITPANAAQVMLLDRLGTGALQDMAWLPDGQTVVAAFYTGLSLCDAGTLTERQFIPAYGRMSGLAASPDGRHVALIAEDTVQLWDTSNGQMVEALEAPSGGASLIAFGAGGRLLAISGPEVEGEPSSETVAVWDIAGALGGSTPADRLLYRLDGFVSMVSGLAFSPDDATLVTVRYHDSSNPDDASPLALWDASTGQPLPAEGDLRAAPDGLQHLAFSPDGRLIAGADGSTIHLWNAATGQLLQDLDNQAFMYSLAFSADGRWLAAGSSDKTARVWNLSSATLKASLSGHADWVIRVAFDPAASPPTGAALLATATARDGVQWWDV